MKTSQAYKDGFRSGRLDKTIGTRSRYTSYVESGANKYVIEYAKGYKAGFNSTKTKMNPRKRRKKARKNPVQHVRPHSKKKPRWRIGKLARVHAHAGMKRAFAKFYVQVRRGAKWQSLGGFEKKQYAIDYGRTLADAHPSKKFRVFW